MCVTQQLLALGVHNSTCVTYPVNDTLLIQAALVAGFVCMDSISGVNIERSDTEQRLETRQMERGKLPQTVNSSMPRTTPSLSPKLTTRDTDRPADEPVIFA